MKDHEQLFDSVLGRAFDTPKKLNRSAKVIPSAIVDKLENGEFTFEMLDQLKSDFPIFYYRTCCTIHGSWGVVTRDRIGYYKNIRQNQCGSVEVLWSAIDCQKIKQIRQFNNSVEVPRHFHFSENSSERGFILSEQVTKETLPDLRTQYTEIANRLKQLNIYGKVSVYLTGAWGIFFINCYLAVYAVPEVEVNSLVLALTGLTQQQFIENCAVTTAKREADEARLKAERDAREAQSLIEVEARQKLFNEVYLPQVEHLPETKSIADGPIVKAIRNRSANEYEFCYYRITGKGAFGRVDWERATSPVFTTDLETLKWEKQKQQRLTDFKTTTGWRLVLPSPKPSKTKTALQGHNVQTTHALSQSSATHQIIWNL